jgi:multidrug efflux pump subunit AcrA (membrane-fusion protein)
MVEIFNKEALDALDDHSEEQEMARVASPKLRLVLAAMIAMIVVVLFWCIFGTINYKVTAQGVVFPFGEASPVSVPYEGTVSRCLVGHGEAVSYGTPVVEIRTPLSTTAVAAPRDGVVISTLQPGTLFKAGEPVAWLLPQAQKMTGREMLCYVTYDGLRDLKTGMQVQVTPANRQRERWGYACGTVVGIEEYPTNRQEIVNRVKLDPLASFIEDGQAVYEVRVTLDEQDGKLVWSREKSKDVKIGNGSLCDIQIITHKKPVWRVLIGAVENATETVMGN